MAGSTVHYGLGYFDFGDPLGSDFAGQVEIDRFVLIDKMLFGMMSVFGNGVITGWEVSQSGPFDIEVSPGAGNINFIAGRTQISASVTNMPMNSVMYVYARIQDKTAWSEDVDFFVSNTPYVTNTNAVLLAAVSTGPEAILTIDNSVRTEIGFLQIILDAIARHRHRGGADHPSKIDLASEVKGQIPAFRIADFDAEKITTGTFDLSVIPLLNHSDLKNVGLATHPQLDSFVKTLKASNRELFGEIGTANLLQFILAAKFLYEDPASPLYSGSRIDRNMINEFCVIPGITPDTYIDFDNSNAVIDLDAHEVRGIPSVTGTTFHVKYDSALAWESAYSNENLVVSGSDVTLGYSTEQAEEIISIDSFDSGQGENGGWTVEVATIQGGGEVVPGMEGSGKFDTQTSFEMRFTKTFRSAQDWSDFDRLSYMVRCTDTLHGIVRMAFEGGGQRFEVPDPVLEENEVTSNPENVDFEIRIVDITAIPFVNRIDKIIIYHRDLQTGFRFYIDNIQIMRTLLLPEEGHMRLRYSANSKITFNQIDWLSTELAGTTLAIRARAADNQSLLSRADWTPYLENGQIINLRGTDLEIEINMYPDSTRRYAPVLDWLRILIVSTGEIDGYSIDTVAEFERGTADNVEIKDGPVIDITTPVQVGSYYFILANVVNQYYQSGGNVEGSWFGADAPIAPNQVVRAVESESYSVSPSLAEPRQVSRSYRRTYIIADTYNDRILEYDVEGNLVDGVGCINWTHNGDKPFPVASCVDTRDGILYVVWTQKVPLDTVNVSQLRLHQIGSTEEVRLTRDLDKINDLSTSELSGAQAQIMKVYLTPQNRAIVERMDKLKTYLTVTDEAISSGLLHGDKSLMSYTALTENGVKCYLGNFAYAEGGIFTPTWAERTELNRYLIANATVGLPTIEIPEPQGSVYIKDSLAWNEQISALSEVDEYHNNIWAPKNDVMNFSPFIPGGVKTIRTNRYLIGGIKPGSGTEGEPKDNRKFDFRSIKGDIPTREDQRKTLKDVLLNGDSSFKGRVIVYDKLNDIVVFDYTCPEGLLASDVDTDSEGNYVVAESSFEQSGRVVKVDSLGNIVFSFGEGTYSVINDIDVHGESMLIST